MLLMLLMLLMLMLMLMMMMMITVGPFGTTCSDMFQIMFNIALKMDVTMCDHVTMWLTDELIGFLELLFQTKNIFYQHIIFICDILLWFIFLSCLYDWTCWKTGASLCLEMLENWRLYPLGHGGKLEPLSDWNIGELEPLSDLTYWMTGSLSDRTYWRPLADLETRSTGASFIMSIHIASSLLYHDSTMIFLMLI